MKRKFLGTLLLAMLSVPSVTYGQGRVTLKQLYEMAEERSTSIRAAMMEVKAARHGNEVAKAQRLPDIGVSASAGYLGDGLLSDRDLTSWQHISNPHFTNNFSLKAQQVIYAGGAISTGITMAQLSEQMALLNVASNRQEVLFVITSHYLDLCRLQNRMTVVDRNMEQTLYVIDNMRSRYTQGTVLSTDITRYELQMESLKLQKKKISDAQCIINHQLAVILHQPEDFKIDPDLESVKAMTSMNAENDWHALAAANNLGLKQSDLEVRIGENRVKMQRAEMLPKVAVVAEEHFDGPITIEVPVIDKNFNYWFAGIGVSYNLSSLFKSDKKMRQAKARLYECQEQHNLAKENVDKAIQAAYIDYLTAFKELDTQKKSVELADECYQVTENRYRNGLALLTDMLDASNAKLSAELALVDADINIIFNYFKLKYISNTL